ncbi:type II secretion system protein N, partial [Rhizobium brockwellii]|uniref:type II secretion system protein N n=1 Tax=Rhizobium brockwellii TaxID=3019932 RepID=UPI003F98BC17
WVIVTPVSPLGEWRPLAPAIAGSASAILEGFDPFFRVQGQQAAPDAVTTLQLTLFGTRLDEASGRGSAILAGPDGVQRSVSVGEEIQPGVT